MTLNELYYELLMQDIGEIFKINSFFNYIHFNGRYYVRSYSMIPPRGYISNIEAVDYDGSLTMNHTQLQRID